MRTTLALFQVTAAMAVLAWSHDAAAARFTVIIRNDNKIATQTGLLTLQPLITTTTSTGATLASLVGTTQWNTYGYISDDCDVTANDDGDAVALATAWGLTLGVNAWVVPALKTQTVAQLDIDVTDTTAKLYFIAATATAATGTTPSDADDFVVGIQRTSSTSPPETELGLVGIPLFSSGYPVDSVDMSLSAWDANSKSASNGNTDPNNGTGNSAKSHRCTTLGTGGACGTTWDKNSVFHDLPCYVAVHNGTFTGTSAGTFGPVQPPAPALTAQFADTLGATDGYRPDGMALGNFSSVTTRQELAVIEEDGDATFGPTSAGRMRVISFSGALVGSFTNPTGGHDLEGIPVAINLDGGSQSEIAFGESTSPGYVFARRGTGATAYPGWAAGATYPAGEVGPYGYPGLFNMGPSVADLQGSSSEELVIVDWNGNLVIRNGSDGALLGTYDAYTDPAVREGFDSLVAIADVFTTSNCPAVSGADCSGLEIVGFGNLTGHVFVLDRYGTRLWVSATATGPSSASSPAVGDLDGDGKAEVVVLPEGTLTAVAFTPSVSTSAQYTWALPGDDYYWTSPTIANVLPKTSDTSRREVIVESSNAELSVLELTPTTHDESVAFSYFVGLGDTHAACDPLSSTSVCEDAWFTPSVSDVLSEMARGPQETLTNFSVRTNAGETTHDEIIAATLSTVEVIDPIPMATAVVSVGTSGYTYKLKYDTTEVTYTATSASTTTIAAGLTAALNASATLNANTSQATQVMYATYDGATITVKAKQPGGAFALTESDTGSKLAITAGWSPRVAFRTSASTAQFYPTALVRAGETATTNPARPASGNCGTVSGVICASVYINGWNNGIIYRFDTPQPTFANTPVSNATPASPMATRIPATDWATYMGNPAHTGYAQ
jgi:hypothetical protein